MRLAAQRSSRPHRRNRAHRRLTTGELIRVDLTDTDWQRTRDLVEGYTNVDIGRVDASIIAVAERLGITTIATVDHRHFTVVRPAHCDAFELIP